MDVRQTFAQEFGAEPEGVWSAPGRVNLIGEHTDYNGGLALPIAIPQRTYAAAARRDDDRLRIHGVQAGETVEIALADVAPGAVNGWAAYVAGVPWALRRAGHAVGGLDLVIDGEVPLGAGLSSSAALECAVAAAYSDLAGLGLLETPEGRAELVTACRLAENEIAGAPTGGMDQSASLLAQAEHALRLDCRDGATAQVPFALAAADLTLLVVDTKAEHALVDGQYGARRASCERAAAALGVQTLREIPAADLEATLSRLAGVLAADDPDGPEVVARRVRHVVTEITRVEESVAALEDGAWDALGELFAASHASLRDDYEVSCAELDVAVDAATAAGALGARMTGGGFGGSAIALAPRAAADAIAAAVRAAYAERGWRAPEIFTATASRGAGREG